ncbi:MAG: tRNA pseudouridine(38-40) synthase TruA [candidate division WOR-3 bacterium]|jgi:tRNA pseudouridine38-40 synthase
MGGISSSGRELNRQGELIKNIKLTIEFDGTDYAGWQIQSGQPTVQGLIENAVARVFGQAITVYGCSRTDAGVSARNYTANFFMPLKLPVDRIPAALNHYLPPAIYVHQAEVVPDDFHARYSARVKTYVYHLICGRSPLRRRFAWEYPGRLDLSRLKKGARLFVGTRDFSRFCFVRSGNGVCTVKSITVRSRQDELLITVRGDRFLYKLVRRMVGALVAYAAGRITSRDIRAALAGRKHKPFITAPAHGLILERVGY